MMSNAMLTCRICANLCPRTESDFDLNLFFETNSRGECRAKREQMKTCNPVKFSPISNIRLSIIQIRHNVSFEGTQIIVFLSDNTVFRMTFTLCVSIYKHDSNFLMVTNRVFVYGGKRFMVFPLRGNRALSILFTAVFEDHLTKLSL